MPTLTLQRIWCKKCNDWSLHHKTAPPQTQWQCRACGTDYTDITYAEIPQEFLQEQRKRYTEYQTKKTNEFFEGGMLAGLFGMRKTNNGWGEGGSDVEIIECDAGQKAIDARRRQKEKEERAAGLLAQEARRKEMLKFIYLGRNDQCACGSGKKYKKCCIEKYS